MNSNKKAAPKNPLWETFTAGMDSKWSKRLMMVMVPVFVVLFIARPFIDEKAEKRIKNRYQDEEARHLQEKEERLRRLKQSGDPAVVAVIESIEERKRVSDQLLSKQQKS